jgi:S-adenosylmethionine decarboxylase
MTGTHLGRHLIADLHGIAPAALRDAERLRRCLLDAAEACALTPVAPAVIHPFAGGGQGVTGFLLLAESHIAAHTYPEHGLLAMDVFSCGPADPRRALVVARRAYAPGRIAARIASRGRALAGHE